MTIWALLLDGCFWDGTWKKLEYSGESWLLIYSLFSCGWSCWLNKNSPVVILQTGCFERTSVLPSRTTSAKRLMLTTYLWYNCLQTGGVYLYMDWPIRSEDCGIKPDALILREEPIAFERWTWPCISNNSPLSKTYCMLSLVYFWSVKVCHVFTPNYTSLYRFISRFTFSLDTAPQLCSPVFNPQHGTSAPSLPASVWVSSKFSSCLDQVMLTGLVMDACWCCFVQ